MIIIIASIYFFFDSSAREMNNFTRHVMNNFFKGRFAHYLKSIKEDKNFCVSKLHSLTETINF